MKAAVGYRNGQLSITWSPIAENVSLEGLTAGAIVDAATCDDALPAYDAVKGTNLAIIRAKQWEIEQGYAAAIAAGYDTGLGFALKLHEGDQRVLFDYQQRLLRQLAQDPPEITPTDIRPLKGTDNAWHLVTVADLIAAVDQGAAHIESLNGAYAGYEAMLTAGVTDFQVTFVTEPG